MAEIYGGTDGAPTGNPYLDSLIMGGAWVETLGTGVTLTWATATSGFHTTNYYSDQPEWTLSETSALAAALQSWANVANITLVRGDSETAGLDLRFIKVTDEQMNANEGENVVGSGEPPVSVNSKPLTCILDSDIAQWTQGFQRGGAGFATMVHEIGHMLGLAHPHPGDGNDDPFPGVDNSADTGDFGLNQKIFTVMSYNRGIAANPGPFTNAGHMMGPMAFDIAAIQALYGANTTFASGDDLYVLPQVNQTGTGWICIWDTGGADTITADGSDKSVIIDLRPAPLTGARAGGYLSAKFGIAGGFTVANGVTIENAMGGVNHDILYGNEAANLLDGGHAGDDLFYGFGGADTLIGSQGWDRMNGGDGDDSMDGGITGRDRLSGAAGNDTMIVWGDASTLSGGAGNDLMTGSITGDLINGDSGNDVIEGEGGNDNLDGGSGNDTVRGGNGNDSVFADVGDDLVYGDDVAGGTGDDTVFGWSGADTLFGGSGNDVLLGHSGNDSIDGGKGDDNLDGGPGADTVLGQDGDDYVEGGDHNDSLLGGDGNDHLVGEAGNDKLRGEAGADTLDGGEENDVLSGGTGADLLLGGKGDDYLSGDADDDTVDGGAGNDRAYGGYGKDSIDGGDGNDYVSGGYDSDTVHGGAGADTLAGGPGGDVFLFASLDDFLFGTPDLILDFNPNTRLGDVMDFRLIDANGRLDGDQSFAFYGARPGSIGMGTLWLEAGREGIMTLFGEVTGDEVADFAVELRNVKTLTEASFLL